MDWEAFYSRFREPDFVPGYEIQNRLGGGAFGEVYKARKHSIGKAYAIKFLKIDDDAQREAVERELEQVRHFAAIDHPNLVTIEDIGTVMGVPYLVMGYAGEDTLGRLLRRERLAPERALLFFVQACRGVLALHDRRLAHFDLKPSNVFIKGEIARVGDYGLSKMMTDGKLTLTFGRGTPQYMAPEMLKNRADHRADVYSLGVILYESVAGDLPYKSDLPGAISLREDDAPPPFPAAFPPELRRAAERCLRLSPEDRYPTIADLLADLGATARPGESAILARRDGSPVPAPSSRAPETPRAGAASPAQSPTRQTAAELTRGAVEVARGMWDGLRTAGARPSRAEPVAPPVLPRPSSTPLPGARAAPLPGTPAAPAYGAPSAPHSGAPATPGAGAPATPSSGAPAASLAAASASPAPAAHATRGASARAVEPAVVMHALGETSAPSGGSILPAAFSPGAATAAAAAGTIPVPPRAKGGWIGTAWATLLLSMEVLFTLVRGLASRAASGLGGFGGQARGAAASGTSRRIGRALAGLVRVLVFVLVLALLGGVLTLLAVLFWTRGGR